MSDLKDMDRNLWPTRIAQQKLSNNKSSSNFAANNGIKKDAPNRSQSNVSSSTQSTASSCTPREHRSNLDRKFSSGQSASSPRNKQVVNEAEVGSLARPGSKKGNINNWINWTLEPQGGGSRGRQTQHYEGHYHTRHKSNYNKEQYLLANCQFVVVPNFDAKLNLVNPDALIEWEKIVELRIRNEQLPACPICLYPPIAAKMTRCGHVYCWSCILHYLALSDHSWRKCPICFESIYGHQLKSVTATQVQSCTVGSTLQMTLMQRAKGSTVVRPVQWETDGNERFAKLIINDNANLSVIEREKTELNAKLVEDREEPEACFIREALNLLREREALLNSSDATLDDVEKLVNEVRVEKTNVKNLQTNSVIYSDAFNDVEVEQQSAPSSPVSHLPEPINDSIDIPVAPLSPDLVHFYQANDGQPIYLHPMTARCIIHQYGQLGSGPSSISGTVLQIESHVMSDELRVRYRYLSHLPLSTCFSLVELQMDGDLLDEATLEHFADELARRHRARQRKNWQEKKMSDKAEQLQRALLYDPANYSRYVSESESTGLPPEIPITHVVVSAEREIRSGWNSESNDNGAVQKRDNVNGSPPSFAQMLRTSRPRTTAAPPSAPVALIVHAESSTTPTFASAWSDAVDVALQDMNNSTDSPQNTSGKKKKKGKKIVLFATGTAAPKH